MTNQINHNTPEDISPTSCFKSMGWSEGEVYWLKVREASLSDGLPNL